VFDISFGELLLIGVVALVVLGPERLPVVARTLGALVARAQRFVMSVKTDIQQQADLSGLASLKQEVQETAFALKEQLTAEIDQAQNVIKATQAQALALPAEPAQAEPLAVAASHAADAPVVEAPVAEPATAAVAGHTDSAAAAVVVHDENQLDLFAAEPTPVVSPSDEMRK
jgi:sec-independent protein translocase protein TatB